MEHAKVTSAKQEVSEIRLEIYALEVQREAFRKETHHRLYQEGRTVNPRHEIVRLNSLIRKLKRRLDNEWRLVAAAAIMEAEEIEWEEYRRQVQSRNTAKA